MKPNKEWHLTNRMPKNASLEQRIAWHNEHEKNCACRDIPDKLKNEMKKNEDQIMNPPNINFNVLCY